MLSCLPFGTLITLAAMGSIAWSDTGERLRDRIQRQGGMCAPSAKVVYAILMPDPSIGNDLSRHGGATVAVKSKASAGTHKWAQCFRISSKSGLHRSSHLRQPVSTPSTGGDAKGASSAELELSAALLCLTPTARRSLRQWRAACFRAVTAARYSKNSD
jgi:hypothetical protein